MSSLLARVGHDNLQSLDDFYRAFFQVEVPAGTSASCAWSGTVRPFQSDEEARLLLRCLDRDLPVDIDQGTLRLPANALSLTAHPLEQWLVKTTIAFSIVVLEFEAPRHPQAFSIRPRIDGVVHPGQPHLRFDQLLSCGGRETPALCVYSAAEFSYSNLVPRTVEFVDQTATYLAKHVIWLRTRRLYDFAGNPVYQPAPGEAIVDIEPRNTYVPGIHRTPRQGTRIWRGYWAGISAPSGAVNHNRTIKPDGECWCGSGETYRRCHIQPEIGVMPDARNDQERTALKPR